MTHIYSKNCVPLLAIKTVMTGLGAKQFPLRQQPVIGLLVITVLVYFLMWRVTFVFETDACLVAMSQLYFQTAFKQYSGSRLN